MSADSDLVTTQSRLTARQAAQVLERVEDLQVVDVRGPGEFEDGALPGAVNLPLPRLRARLSELDPRRPVLQPCRVRKDLSDFGISDQDACQGSELAYQGPEVEPLALLARGAPQAIRRLASTLTPAGRPKTATAA